MINRQIYKGEFDVIMRGMANEMKQWWKGLGEELEVDIETFDD
ncbi:MAG: hypothetical protein ACE5R5_00215 [Nitrosarchaeum sp.]